MTNREIQTLTLESLRDWFKKEKWVRISTSGNIAGPCGTSKNKKNPDRCLPKAKAQSLSKAQRAATARKKKKAGAKGKTVVKNTKAATVKKENLGKVEEANISKLSTDKLRRIIKQADGERVSPAFASQVRAAYAELKKRGESTTTTVKKETKEAPAGHYFTKSGNLVKGRMTKDAKERGARKSDPKDKMRSKVPPVSQTREGYYSNTQLEDEIRQYGYDSFEQFFADNPGAEEAVFDFIDQNLARMQKETSNPQDGKAAPYGSGYKKVTKEDIRNLIVGTIHEMQNEGTIEEKDDRCTRLAKQKYDTWPSAYASGAVVRCRRGEIWKKK